MKQYRCLRPKCQNRNKGLFKAEQPTCPQCNLQANDPKFGHMICRLVVVHFDPPTDFPGMGQGYRACDHAKTIQADPGTGGVPNPWHAGTGAINAVTCSECKETTEYKTAAALQDERS